ncbi:uncharacterized protein [Penaeus vannamei]|uniref:uncharacterized protein n=1 Tax=Penaeus vannamei TaxID=6689 RepID=UPI00387F93C4
MERTLGMHWSMENDYFTYKINPKDKPLTRRGVLSVVASIYDPLGMVAPFTLSDMCRQQLGWDEEMETAEVTQWRAWLNQLPKLINFKVPRSFIPMSFSTVRSCQLHHFADASQVGYGIASYLRLESATGEVYCTLVMGRSRVAPLKRMTIPRLELTAATVAARMDQKLRSELNLRLEKSVFWTDSTSVLKYLFNEKARHQTFVANRVNLIRELSPIEAWRYVETRSNPADLASRGVDMDSFLASSIWITGPTFLSENEKMWPILPNDVKRGTLEDDLEVKSPQLVCETVITAMSFIEEIDSRFSNWMKFVHCIAWLRRFHRTLTQRFKSSDSFGAEIKILSGSEEAHVRSSSKLVQLKPCLKDGLLRVRGRLIHSPSSIDVKHPIILPSKSMAVKLMVQWKHNNLAHSGHNYLMAELRQRFWIIHGNAVVRSDIRNCVKCRSLSARPMIQEMADLPEDRITSNVPPFTHTRTDCFGPFLVKKGRSNLKRFGVIFTCLVTRAIHIEVVESMETDFYINAFRRFIARRGPVTSIRSDNGTNLVGAKKELRKELEKLKHSVIAEVMLLKGVTWQFNPPHASHFGGVEAIINGRPLTRVTDPDGPQPLTPNMLLTLKGAGGPITDTDHSDVYVRRRWRQFQYLADLFWKRWTKEYLPLLQERQKWTTRQRNLKVGDIVLSLDNKLPRGSWPLGRVLEVISDADGHVRSARLKTASGEYLRPISKMCLLLENEIDLGYFWEELAVKVLKNCLSHSDNPKDFSVVWERALELGLSPCRMISTFTWSSHWLVLIVYCFQSFDIRKIMLYQESPNLNNCGTLFNDLYFSKWLPMFYLFAARIQEIILDALIDADYTKSSANFSWFGATIGQAFSGSKCPLTAPLESEVANLARAPWS